MSKRMIIGLLTVLLGACAELEALQEQSLGNTIGAMITGSSSPPAGASLSVENATLTYRDRGALTLRYNDGIRIEALSMSGQEAPNYLRAFQEFINLEAEAQRLGRRGVEQKLATVSSKRMAPIEEITGGGPRIALPKDVTFKVDTAGRAYLSVVGRGEFANLSSPAVHAFAELLQRRGEAS